MDNGKENGNYYLGFRVYCPEALRPKLSAQPRAWPPPGMFYPAASMSYKCNVGGRTSTEIAFSRGSGTFHPLEFATLAWRAAQHK